MDTIPIYYSTDESGTTTLGYVWKQSAIDCQGPSRRLGPNKLPYDRGLPDLGDFLDHPTVTASATAGTGATGVMPTTTNITDGSSPKCTPWSMHLNPTRTRDPGYLYTHPPLLPTAPGTIPGCYLYDTPANYGRDDFASVYEITMSELLAWNSWLMRDRDTALYANIEESVTRAIYMGTSTASPASITLPETRAHTTAYQAKFD
ncbi:uncharacterized protein P174DRAFT_435426 [Aspergillus novofumigatus IBT 16806]|uniref:Uncharacterized protein n=1 Tax=Aspergillus novofumigatus (strain IBT 16806) TaxID=1392255 RepID=A0A2I1BVJ1_ASPN1|nr:uncharacterized protein P174DRAFT_435426 [Aspergillus novofumigatus IBT 16806]PKX89321.1 hypothetical protein P174DRAFT_435426 [Aspergillus novofumigatus IBT 16806]